MSPYNLLRDLQDISSRHLQEMSSRRLQDQQMFAGTFKVLKDNVNTFSCNVYIEHCHNHPVSSLEHLIFWRFYIIIPFTFWDICALEICEMLSDIKNYYWFILLLAFGQFSGHDHTVLINEYQRNYDVIMSKYVRKLNKSHW